MLSGTHTHSVTSITVVNDFRPHISTVNASSHGQIFVGASLRARSADLNSKKPFTFKFKTNSIKIFQSCRRNYEGPNDTMGLVAHAERRVVSKLATGTQILEGQAILSTTCIWHVSKQQIVPSLETKIW